MARKGNFSLKPGSRNLTLSPFCDVNWTVSLLNLRDLPTAFSGDLLTSHSAWTIGRKPPAPQRSGYTAKVQTCIAFLSCADFSRLGPHLICDQGPVHRVQIAQALLIQPPLALLPDPLQALLQRSILAVPQLQAPQNR